MSRFSKWLRNAQPGGCARSPADGGLNIAPKTALKSRVCSVYESVFEGLDPSEGKGDSFWNEIWLLKVDDVHIANCIQMMSEEELLQSSVKVSIIALLASAKGAFCNSSQHPVRRLRSAQTLTIFIYCILRKQGWDNFAVDVLSVICGVSASQRFFKDILQAIVDNSVKATSEPSKGRDSAIAIHDASIALLKGICCGNINCGSNPLIEIPVKHLSKSTFIQSALTRLTLTDSIPTQQLIDTVCVLSVLSKYEKYQLGESNLSNKIASLSGAALNSLVKTVNWTLDQYVIGQYELSKTKTSSARSLGNFVTGVFYGGGVKTDVQHDMFDTNSRNYNKIPTGVASCLILLLDLAQNSSFIEILLTSSEPLSEICPWSSDRTGDDFTVQCSPTLGRIFITTSILMQLGKHPAIAAATSVLFRVWLALLSNRKFIVAMHSPDLSAYSIMEKGISALSPTAPMFGCRSRDANSVEGGVKVGVLLRILQQYVYLNQNGSIDVPSFDLAISIFNKVLFYQLENKVRLDWASAHFFEKLFFFISALAAPGMVGNLPGARLLKKVITLVKILLRAPTVLFSEDFRLRFIYELVRCGGRLLALDQEIEREGMSLSFFVCFHIPLLKKKKEKITVPSATPNAALILTDVKSYLSHIIEFVSRIEVDISQQEDCRGERDVVMQIIEDTVQEDETACRHKELWSLQKSVYQDLSMGKRDSSVCFFFFFFFFFNCYFTDGCLLALGCKVS